MWNNHFFKSFWLIAIFTFSTVSIQAQNNLSEKDTKSIKEIKETYRTAWLQNDSKTILSLFTDGATIYPNGLSPKKGTKALSDFWFSPSDSTTLITEYKINLEEISGEKKLAFVTGSTEIRWTITNMKSNEVKKYASKGNFLTVLVKQKNEWKITKHIWNGKFEEIK